MLSIECGWMKWYVYFTNSFVKRESCFSYLMQTLQIEILDNRISLFFHCSKSYFREIGMQCEKRNHSTVKNGQVNMQTVQVHIIYHCSTSTAGGIWSSQWQVNQPHFLYLQSRNVVVSFFIGHPIWGLDIHGHRIMVWHEYQTNWDRSWLDHVKYIFPDVLNKL